MYTFTGGDTVFVFIDFVWQLAELLLMKNCNWIPTFLTLIEESVGRKVYWAPPLYCEFLQQLRCQKLSILNIHYYLSLYDHVYDAACPSTSHHAWIASE